LATATDVVVVVVVLIVKFNNGRMAKIEVVAGQCLGSQ
jgi:cadmium resistance protein CadD (predicted permease)